MILLLMRHGIAEDYPSPPDGGDAQRQLTEKGRRKSREVGAALAKAGLRPTHYVSSLRARAIQTAREIREVFKSSAEIHPLDSMDIGGHWKNVVGDLQELTELREDAVVLAAGHMPSCGRFLCEALIQLTGTIDFKKGAVAAIRWEGPISHSRGELILFLTPKYAGSASNETEDED